MTGQFIHAVVTDNNDPLMLGRIKFKSVEFLNDLEHPVWAENSSACLGGGWGLFMVPDIGTSIHIFIPQGSDDAPVYIASNPLNQGDIPPEVRQDYPNKAIVKFWDIGYLLLERTEQRVTLASKKDVQILAKANVTVIAEQDVQVSAKGDAKVVAEGNAELSAGGSAQVLAQGLARVSGSSVSIEASSGSSILMGISVPNLPSLPDIPALPSVDGALPEIPDIPEIPSLPDLSMPATPHFELGAGGVLPSTAGLARQMDLQAVSNNIYGFLGSWLGPLSALVSLPGIPNPLPTAPASAIAKVKGAL